MEQTTDRQLDYRAGQISSLEGQLSDLGEKIDTIAAAQLTAEDIASLRVIIEQDRRTRWLWSTARAWALWITAVVAGWTIGVDALKSALKRLIA